MAGGRQAYAAAERLEERRCESFLEPADRPSQRRLTPIEPFRSVTEMTELRDRCEVAQIPKINLIGHGYQSQRKSKWTTADIYSNNRCASSGALLTN